MVSPTLSTAAGASLLQQIYCSGSEAPLSPQFLVFLQAILYSRSSALSNYGVSNAGLEIYKRAQSASQQQQQRLYDVDKPAYILRCYAHIVTTHSTAPANISPFTPVTAATYKSILHFSQQILACDLLIY